MVLGRLPREQSYIPVSSGDVDALLTGSLGGPCLGTYFECMLPEPGTTGTWKRLGCFRKPNPPVS